MEYRITDSFSNSIFRNKLDCISDCPNSFYKKCSPQDSFNKLDQSLKRRQTVSFLDHDPLFHIDSFSKQNEKCSCTCNDSKSANLDQYKQDHFSCHSKLRRRNNRHKSCHTDTGYSCKQCINIADRLMVRKRKP